MRIYIHKAARLSVPSFFRHARFDNAEQENESALYKVRHSIDGINFGPSVRARDAEKEKKTPKNKKSKRKKNERNVEEKDEQVRYVYIHSEAAKVGRRGKKQESPRAVYRYILL